MKNFDKKTKIIILVATTFVIAATLFMFSGFSFSVSKIRKDNSTIMPTATGNSDPINDGAVISQTYINSTEKISRVGIVFFRITYYEDVDVVLELWDGNNLIASNTYRTEQIEDNHRTYIDVYNNENMINKELTIKVYSKEDKDSGMTIMVDENSNSTYKYNNKTMNGTLCFSITE